MTTDDVLLLAAACAAGAVNSIAGGGSLITFPTLVWLGREPIVANATNTVSLWPGSLAAVWALRHALTGLRGWVAWGSAVSALGGLLGAILLLWTPSQVFAALVPWLVAFATVLFALSGPITARLRRATPTGDGDVPLDPRHAGGLLFQLGVSIYGGYFGAGMGIMMLAGLALLGFGSIHAMLVLRNVWAVWINGVAALWFVAKGAVAWRDAAVLTVGQVTGSWLGAHAARRLPPAAVRAVVIAVGVGMFVGLLLRG